MKEGITHDLRTISQRNRRFGALCGAEQILGEDPRSEPVSALISRGNIKCLGGCERRTLWEDALGGAEPRTLWEEGPRSESGGPGSEPGSHLL